MAERLLNTSLPGREPLALAVRLRGLSLASPLITRPSPEPLAVGFEDAFWILDQRSAQLFQTRATLRLVTPNAYWFVDSDMTDRAPQADLERSAAVFETKTYPLIYTYFGSVPSPAVNGDPRVLLLLGNVPGVAAYFSSADAYPRAVNPRSNEYAMIYVNLNILRPGQAGFDSTIVHELQHLAHFGRCPNQEGWVDEGASELASRIAGYEGGPPAAFTARPDTQLTTWANQPADAARHYQASYLFLRYVAERAWQALPRVFATCARGEALFASFLAEEPLAPDLDSLFADWTVANLLQDNSVADGRYAYANGAFRVAVTGHVQYQTPFLGSVPQFAANYLDLPVGEGSVAFKGDPLVPLLAAGVDGAGAWWSNRGDSLDSRLTRRLDLSGVPAATLRFRAWYDIEDQFDFVYLSASADGGKTWQVVPATHTVPDQATGNNYGVGWTGTSQAEWVEEQADLTPFVGSEVLVRFEYVTDQSYNGHGFALKDVRVPQIGLDEIGAVEEPWTVEGWVRVDAPIPERWNLRLVRWTASGVMVEPVPVGADGSATFQLDQTASRTTLVVAPTAPRTIVPGNYSLAVSSETALVCALL
jgi:hypothetical protein